MTKKLYALITLMLSLLLVFVFAACTEPANEDPNGDDGDIVDNTDNTDNNDDDDNSDVTIVDGYQYDGTATVAPFTVYNEDGTLATETSYSSMFLAIRYAGENALSTNKMYVLDATDTLIFQRQANSQCWCYDSTYFVGVKERTEAIAWAETKPYSYVINGQGTSYVYLGSEDFTERSSESVYELASGGHTYLFSNVGVIEANQWTSYGYAYACATIRLSEVTYYEAGLTSSTGWNAYVFFNIRGAFNCDLGLGCFVGGGGAWKLVANCSNTEHSTGADPLPSFYVYQDKTVTTMTQDENGVYSGADDVFLEAMATTDTFTCRVTNLRTGEVFEYTHTHEGMHEGAEGYFRVVACSSYCPVMGSVWDARAGSYLKNVVWEDVKIARYKPDGDYTDADLEDFYPGESSCQCAFTQGADTAHLEYGTRTESGTYASGATYSAGSKYMIFSSYYDGTHITS